MEPQTWHKRREDKVCELVEVELDVLAFLDWLNSHADFSSDAFCITNAMLVGRPVGSRDELRVYLIFHHYATNTVAVSPFEFYQETLEPFLREPVPRARTRGL